MRKSHRNPALWRAARHFALGCILAIAPIAAAAEGEGQAPAPAVAPEKDPNKIVCKRERVTGSHIKRKVCRTQAQLDELRSASQETMREMGPKGPPQNTGH